MNWDRALLLWINRGIACPILDWVMSAITVAAMPAIALMPPALLLAGKRWRGRALLAVLVLSTGSAVALQFLLARPRPQGVRLVLPQAVFHSFPSGHAASTFGYALFAALVRRRAGVPAWLGAIAVSLSRVYLGHHYPSDVLGGAILGLAAGAMGYGLYTLRGDEKRPWWAWLLWGQVAVVLIATLGAYLGLLNVPLLAVPGADKLLHATLFGALSFTAVGWWARRPAIEVLTILVLLALADEGLQVFSAMRCYDPLDLAATLAGILFFGWLAARARGHVRRDRGPHGAVLETLKH